MKLTVKLQNEYGNKGIRGIREQRLFKRNGCEVEYSLARKLIE